MLLYRNLPALAGGWRADLGEAAPTHDTLFSLESGGLCPVPVATDQWRQLSGHRRSRATTECVRAMSTP
jgi:hypothetical protein